ncbi:MAG: GNAT family N-acetyltransferase [Acidimicrobiales bacterium]
MLVRRAVPADSESIRAIYNVEVTTSTATLDLVARTPGEQAAWMADHCGVYPAIVAEIEGAIVGFASLSPYRPRPGYATAVEDSVYVAGDHRGKGVGRALLSAAVDTARSHGFHSVIGRIVGDQQASIALHRTCGFEILGVEKQVGRKFGRFLDVTVVQQMLLPKT